MSDPLSTRASSFHFKNNLQPIPEVPTDSGSGGFGRHRVNSNATMDAGWLGVADDMPSGASVSNRNSLEKTQIAVVPDCGQQLNPAPSSPLSTASQGLRNLGGNQDQARDADSETGAGVATPSLAGQDLPDSPAAATAGSDNHTIYNDRCSDNGSDSDSDSETEACSTTSNREPDEPNHKWCQNLRHTDACWNDTRWVEKNQQARDKIEQIVRDHSYQYYPCQPEMRCDQKYRLESGRYIFDSRKLNWNFSHIKITRCVDGEVLVNTVRNVSAPLHWFFQCQDQDWVLTGHSYRSPTLVNLSAGKTYQQRGDRHWARDFLWHGARASPDGRTLAVVGEFFGNDTMIKFYDFSNPDQGFRWLPSNHSYLFPADHRQDIQWPVWSHNSNNQTIATFNMQTDLQTEETPKPSVYSVTIRREGDRMIEESRHKIRARTG